MNEDSLYNRLAKGILTDEEIDNLVDEIMNIPAEKNNNCLSSYGSINVDDLIDSIKELRKVPTHDELLRENEKLKEQLKQKEYIINKIKKCIEEKEEYYGDYMGDGNYTMYSMMGANNNRIPYIKSNLIKQILDNKGDENDG